MCDRPHDQAVRSPWTEGAWLMLEPDVPADWEVRTVVDDDWERPLQVVGTRWLVEARPQAKP
jgi:hypothetical protein